MELTFPDIKTMHKNEVLALLNSMCGNTLMETLSIKFSNMTATTLSATMPVDTKVLQPMGILHGGASAALIETVGSAASFLFIDPNKQIAKGLEISANHLHSEKSGILTATAKPIHIGRTTHIFEVEIYNQDGRKITYGKMTNIIMDIPKNNA
ncbi:MAG: hotdog fold thioesterase [Flavobacteriales bacterium]|jgi:uncharacterized protein (TIGR00369 family)|nr:hotdog fold thioesterase [Flavobacteriales bacterium]